MPVLQKNQTITLEINGYTAEGAGVGHFEGMAVFVPGTLRGETVQCHIIKCTTICRRKIAKYRFFPPHNAALSPFRALRQCTYGI
ncbi:MAG: TRAM domain-containing protein [Christensenellales bacterium]